MSYYHGTTPYPHPTESGKVLCYIRNRQGSGWRVCVSAEDGEKLRPYDLFQNRAGRIECKTITGKQFACPHPYTLFQHVEEWVDKDTTCNPK